VDDFADKYMEGAIDEDLKKRGADESRTVHYVTQAKASQEEVDRLIHFLRSLEELVDSYDEDALLDLLFNGGVPTWERTVFGYLVLVDNACDPDKGYLDWKPEIKKLLHNKE
jgi:hypothetical protein